MNRVCFGIPAYGLQDKDFWNPLISEVASWKNSQLVAPIAVGGMMTDLARNAIVKEFLNTDADWLMWVDADNVVKVGQTERLISTGRTLITGVYVKRVGVPEPIIYHSTPDGAYKHVEKWRPGEILPIDTAGMGGCLCHRSVFEDIRKTYRLLERVSGGYTIVHKDDIQGEVLDEKADTDGKVVEGVFRDRLRIPLHKHDFPYFMLEYGRTEDMGFFERAAKSGHPLWCDTSVELGHLGTRIAKPHDWLVTQ